MKKLNNRGFMLTEVLIVSTLLTTVLLVMYTQFKNIKRTFDQEFKYNNVNDLYSLNNVKKYIEQENYTAMAGRLENDNYVRIESCNNNYYESTEYCERLYENLEIEKLYLTKTNLFKIKDSLDLNKATKDFIKTIESETGQGYRLIAEFKDNRYATLKVFSGSKYKAAIANSCNTASKFEYTIYHKLNKTNQDIISPTIKTAGCSEEINVINSTMKNKCYKPVDYSSHNFSIVSDILSNKATITYERITTTITINYYKSGTTSPLKSSKILTLDCGETFEIDDYIDAIAGVEFKYADKTKFEIGTDAKVINLYYEEVV